MIDDTMTWKEWGVEIEERLKKLEAHTDVSCRGCAHFFNWDGCELSESCETTEHEKWKSKEEPK